MCWTTRTVAWRQPKEQGLQVSWRFPSFLRPTTGLQWEAKSVMEPKQVTVLAEEQQDLKALELQQVTFMVYTFPPNKLLWTEQVHKDTSKKNIRVGEREHLKALTGEEQENFQANAAKVLLQIPWSYPKLQSIICSSCTLAWSGSANQSHSPWDWPYEGQRMETSCQNIARCGVPQAVQHLAYEVQHIICFPKHVHPFPFQLSNILSYRSSRNLPSCIKDRI